MLLEIEDILVETSSQGGQHLDSETFYTPRVISPRATYLIPGTKSENPLEPHTVPVAPVSPSSGG